MSEADIRVIKDELEVEDVMSPEQSNKTSIIQNYSQHNVIAPYFLQSDWDERASEKETRETQSTGSRIRDIKRRKEYEARFNKKQRHDDQVSGQVTQSVELTAFFAPIRAQQLTSLITKQMMLNGPQYTVALFICLKTLIEHLRSSMP